MQQRSLTALAVIASLLLAAGASAEGWASFQNGGRLSHGAKSTTPMQWGPGAGAAWETELAGYGQSSPVVYGGVAYVTSVAGDSKERLLLQAIDVANGEERWRREFKNSSPEENSSYVSRAAPTPACDNLGVVALFEGGNVVALTAEGETRWERDLVADYGAITARHGLAASLEQDSRRVFVWIERQSDPYVLALDKQTGETVWKSPGVGATSWSSPRLVPVGEAEHLVLSAIGTVAGYDPADGRRLWSLEGVTGNSSPTPTPLGDGRFLLGATNGRGEGGGGAAAESNGVVAIRPAPDGGFEANYVWRAKRAVSSFGSPIVHDGYAYFVNRSGVVYCLDASTGEEQFAKRIGSSAWATPLGAGEYVYFFGKNGTTSILKSGPRFEVVVENPLWETEASTSDDSGPRRGGFGGPVLYAAAAVEGALLLRRGDRLYCVKP